MIDPISSGLIGFVVGGATLFVARVMFSRAPHWRAKYVKAELRARCLAAENQGLALKLVEVGYERDALATQARLEAA